MYRLRSDFKLENMSEHFVVTYSKKLQSGSVFSLKDPRCDDLVFRSMVAKDKLVTDVKSTDSYINDKYRYAVIDGNSDMVFEKSIPIEFGADEMRAIDYQKGCYIGQEVISRAKYQGVIRKKIYKLDFGTEIALISQGAVITDLDGNKIGIMCSCHGKIAIAQLREEKYLGLSKKVAMIEGQTADILIPLWR
jgi:tRNA-modifying protein YgfZ